jgi:TonB family protein
MKNAPGTHCLRARCMVYSTMTRTALFLMVFLAGCSAIEQIESPVQPPVLTRSAPLPPIMRVVPEGGMRFSVKILVREDGTVGDEKLLKSSGDPDWDSLALRSIMKWAFIPARREGKPVELWIRQPLVVQLQEPVMRTLAALVSATQQEADSLESLLDHGMDFDTLLGHAVQVPGERSGFLGAVDISVYVPHLRDKLLRLGEGDVSRPLRVGSRFIIYKRLKKEPA